MNATIYDYVIIGGGIVGVSTALQLQQRQSESSILLIEKEAKLAQHQTAHNSGVIHAGVYYQPGSLKADFCKRGAQATMDFCRQHHIPFQQRGKLLVATNPVERQRMTALKQRCEQNGIDCIELNQSELLQREPNISGLGALYIAASGIVDFKKITETMAEQLQRLGGVLSTDTELLAAQEEADHIILKTNQGMFKTRFAISCSGLMADRITKMLGIKPDFAIIPFRGEYYQLPVEKHRLIKHLIYPIPDPALPFLGVHLTPMIDGSITVGPNAVLGWKREGYRPWSFSIKDSLELIQFPGFWKLSKIHLKSGLNEFKNSLYKPGYLKLIKKYCPQLSLNDLQPYPTGIR
ncbi:MAG: L-2-hydroxyglutarate oxidase, partial [Pseudomonadales bacterium]